MILELFIFVQIIESSTPVPAWSGASYAFPIAIWIVSVSSTRTVGLGCCPRTCLPDRQVLKKFSPREFFEPSEKFFRMTNEMNFSFDLRQNTYY
jgi:hypothetical protein